VLGGRAMAALTNICSTLGLEYAGVDFGLAADGSVLLFEANATMVIAKPGKEAHWAYRHVAIDRVLEAATALLVRRSAE